MGRLIVLLMLLLILPACAVHHAQPVAVNTVPPTPAVAGPYTIHPGDVVDIKFFYNPELNETVTVRPDGAISLPLVADLHVVGRTPEEVRRALYDAYGRELKRPDVAVMVRSFSGQRVYIDGEVVRPGMLPLTGPVTVLQSIAAAGGLKETARPEEVIILRRAQGRLAPMTVDVAKAITGEDTSGDIALAPFDIVYVPRSAIADINRWVDLYIRRNIPVGMGFGLGFDLNR